MSDFRVQHFKVLIPAGDSQSDFTIARPVKTDRTRVIKGSPLNQMQAKLPSELDTTFTRDLQIGIELLDSSTVRIHSSANARYDGVAVFSLLEYTGVDGGPNAFTVKRTELFNPLGSNGIDLAAAGFGIEGTPSQTTTHIVGVILDNLVGSDADGDYHGNCVLMPMIRYQTDYDTVEYEQIWVGNSNFATRVWVEQVEWTGSNWTIGFPPFGQGTASRADTITFTTVLGKTVNLATSFDWNQTWIEQARGFDHFTVAVTNEPGSNITPTLPSGTELLAWTPATGDTTNAPMNGASFYAISNPEIKVAHQGREIGNGDSRLESVALGQPSTIEIPIEEDLVSINAETDRLMSVLAGSSLAANGLSDQSVQVVSSDAVSFRRTKGFAAMREYIQTIQFGLDAGGSGTLEDSVIRQPDWLVSIKNR